MSSQHIQLNVPLDLKQAVELVKKLSPSEKQLLGEVLWNEQNIDDIIIPKEHKQIVRERIEKYKNSPESYLTWDEIEDKMAGRK